MELNEKLQELRKQKGITQEELAAALYVSRTAISKWERGTGVPNIESLKALSSYFSISIDELLSGEALLSIAHEDCRRRERRQRRIFFGLIDVSMLLLLFLPIFGDKSGDLVRAVPLFSLCAAPYVKILDLIAIVGCVLFGVLTLALQTRETVFWMRWGHTTSLFLGILSVALFALTLQPYAALFALIFLSIKGVLLLKRQ